MNIAICDDNIQYIKEIRAHVDFYFKEKDMDFHVWEFTSGAEILKSNAVFDIAFLDIELGSVNGLEIGKELKKRNESTVFIVVTAYAHYLDEAMNLQVLRFLDKPVQSTRLYSGLDRAVELINTNTVNIYLKDDDVRKKVALKDIIFLEGELRKTKIVTDVGTFNTSERLSSWEEKLTASFFASPHKSYIVNMDRITEFSRSSIILKGAKDDYMVPIAAKKQSDFKRRIAQFMESRR